MTLPSLDVEMRALMDAERLRPDPPVELRDSVRTKLIAAAIGLGVTASGAGQAAAAGSTGAAATKVAAGPLLSHPIGLALASAAVGTALLVGLSATRPRPLSRAAEGPQTVQATARRPVSPSTAPAAPLPASVPLAAASDRGRAMPRSRQTPSRPVAVVDPSVGPSSELSPATPLAVPSDAALTVERTMLERARRALADGQAKQALEIAAMHERRFPDGRLAEQRERLAVEALLLAGDKAAAQHRFEAFERTYPKSLLLPDLRAALRVAPVVP